MSSGLIDSKSKFAVSYLCSLGIERREVEGNKILPISMHFFQRPAVVFISMKEVPSVLLLNFSVM